MLYKDEINFSKSEAYKISHFLFRLSNKPSKLDDSIWKKISSNPYLVYDEMVWQRRNDCEFETTSW